MPLTHVHGEKEKHRPDRKADHREINHKETNHKKRDYGKQGYRMNESDMTGKNGESMCRLRILQTGEDH